MASERSVLDDLRELVAALDRRVPHLDRKGERDIARDAAALREEAMKRIREIENEDLDRDSDELSRGGRR